MENRKSNRQIKFRVTEEEYQKLINLSEQVGMSIPKLCKSKALAIKFKTPKINRQQGNQLLAEFRKQGNNLNQITKALNTYGDNNEINTEILKELASIQERLDKLWGLL